MIPGSGRSTGEGIGYPLQYSWASLVAQLVKNPPAMGESGLRSLGWEDPLEKGKSTHSSILAWRIPWTVYSPRGCKESDTTEQLSLSLWSSQVALMVKNLPANSGDIKDAGRPLGREDSLEKEMATHSSILTWRILWTEEPGRLKSVGLRRVRYG